MLQSCQSTDHKSMYSQSCEFYWNHEKSLNPQYSCTVQFFRNRPHMLRHSIMIIKMNQIIEIFTAKKNSKKASAHTGSLGRRGYL